MRACVHVEELSHSTNHVFAAAWIAFDHLISRLEAHIRDVVDCELFVVGFLGGDHRRVGGQREVNARIGYKVCLRYCFVLFWKLCDHT